MHQKSIILPLKTKQSLKLAWLKSNTATLQLALFKLICTDEERKALSMNYNDVTSNGKELKGFTIEWGDKKIDV